MLISVRKRAKVFVEPFGAILFLGNLCPHKRETVALKREPPNTPATPNM
jgi:hypothetical protein